MIELKMTLDEAILDLRNDPDFAAIVANVYLDDPVSAAARRFTETDEWHSVQKIVGQPESGAKMLDLGAGRGIAAFAFATTGWSVTALEPDPSDIVGVGAMKALIKESGVDFKIVDAWGESLPFQDHTFDLVYCRQVLHHAKDLDDLVAEMIRVLKPGGTFLATREHVLPREEDLETFLANHPVHQRAGGEHAFTLAAYTDSMKSAGLENIRVLRPWDSSINTFPLTIQTIENRIHRKLRIVPRRFIKPWVVSLAGRLVTFPPGTMYSFTGRKSQ